MDDSTSFTNSRVVHLPFQLALIEIVELLIILLSQRSSKSAKDCGIKVKIHVPDDDSAAVVRWFHVEVQCVGIMKLAIQIKHFLTAHGSHLCQILSEMDKIEQGSHLLIKLPTDSGKESKSIKVTVIDKDKHGAVINTVEEDLKQERKSVVFSFKVFHDFQRVLEECQGIYSYIHRLKIMNPEYELEFHLNIGDSKSKSDFWSGGTKSTFGTKKIATDIRHYVQYPSDIDLRVKPKSGLSSMLPSVHIGQDTTTQLRLSSYAFLVPPPEADVRSLSQMCTDLKLFVYGPCHVPLLLPGKGQTGMTPTSFVKLSDYGLLLTGVAKSNTNAEKAEVEGDWHFKVQSTEAAVAQEPPNDGEQPALCLCVIVILDSIKADQEGQKSLYIIDGLRQCLAQVLCKVRGKIRKCTSSALNKLLHNYTKQDQKQEVYTTAISTVTKSLTSVLKRSTNDSFRNACFNAMKVSDSSQFRNAVFEGLWNIAEDRYGLKSPASKPISSQMDESSCDAFATHLEPAEPAASKDRHAEKNRTPSVDFFDFLTIHRSPPLHLKTDTLLPKVKQSSELSFAKGSEQQAGREAGVAVDNDHSQTIPRTQSQTQPQNVTANAPDPVPKASDTREDKEVEQFCSPSRKKRKEDPSSKMQQPDCFDSLAFNIGFSPEIIHNQQTEKQSSMKQDTGTILHTTSEVQMKPATSLTEDWFNDLLFE